MSRLVTPSIEKLRPYEAGKPIEELARELGISDAVKLASNENPLGPSPLAVKAAQAALGEVHRYPDANTYLLRERLASHLGVRMEEILLGNGSNELLDLLVGTFATPEEHVVFADPAFVVYQLASLAHGVQFTPVPLSDEVHDLPALARAVKANTKVLFVANPNNPTGTYVTRAAMETFLREVPEHVIVAVDEAYFEYADAADYPDCLKLRHLRERLVVLRTFSKIYGLAALRVGYAVGPANLIDYMNRVRAPFNVSSVGQAAALAALDDAAHVELSRSTNREERAKLEAALKEIGFRVVPSQANFVYVDTARPARALYDALLRKGVIVRPFGALPTSLRITVGTRAENERCIAALREVLA